jgi:hypothetical protein
VRACEDARAAVLRKRIDRESIVNVCEVVDALRGSEDVGSGDWDRLIELYGEAVSNASRWQTQVRIIPCGSASYSDSSAGQLVPLG